MCLLPRAAEKGACAQWCTVPEQTPSVDGFPDSKLVAGHHELPLPLPHLQVCHGGRPVPGADLHGDLCVDGCRVHISARLLDDYLPHGHHAAWSAPFSFVGITCESFSWRMERGDQNVKNPAHLSVSFSICNRSSPTCVSSALVDLPTSTTQPVQQRNEIRAPRMLPVCSRWATSSRTARGLGFRVSGFGPPPWTGTVCPGASGA